MEKSSFHNIDVPNNKLNNMEAATSPARPSEIASENQQIDLKVEDEEAKKDAEDIEELKEEKKEKKTSRKKSPKKEGQGGS